MPSYLASVYGGIPTSRVDPTRDAVKDGIKLANECIKKLSRAASDRLHFPPRLLILLASPTYFESRRAAQLIEGIHAEFAGSGYSDVPLIGSSVAGVFFDGQVYRGGALLICLASRLLDVKVAASSTVGSSIERSARSLLEKLDLDSAAGEDPNPFANRVLFTFLPGTTEQGYIATELHKTLRERVWARVPIVGGVSSGFDGKVYRGGLQFINKDVHKNSVVAARLKSGTLLGLSANDGLEPTSKILQITSLDSDRRTVREFNNHPSLEVIKELRRKHGFVVLGKNIFNGDPLVENPWRIKSAPWVQLLRKADDGDAFRVLKINSEKLAKEIGDSIQRSCRSIGLSNPIACLGFRCSSYLANEPDIGIDLHEEIIEVEKKLQLTGGYIGGFVDGEAGKDKLGRSLLRSWSTSTIVFGDELRYRTLVYEGFSKIADFFSRYPSVTEPLDKSIEGLLKLIYDIGFPGVRLFLLVESDEGKRLVVPNSSYSLGSLKSIHKFPHQVNLNRTSIFTDMPAARVERDGNPLFVPYANEAGGTNSDYFAPLKNIKHKTIAVLQIDLGHTKELREVERQLLLQLTAIIGTNLARIFNLQETKYRQKLQEEIKSSLQADDTDKGVERFLVGLVKALELDGSHIRQVRADRYGLELYAGVGAYYKAASKVRRTIDFGDLSPTAKAFDRRKIIIINDAKNDLTHRKMIERQGPGCKLGAALEDVGSYANIPFEARPIVNDDNQNPDQPATRGTISLVSAQPWFFKYPQRRVLNTIAEQVGYVFDHLEQKTAEKIARREAEEARERESETNRRLEFLIGVSPQLSQQDLDDFRGTLENVLSRFCDKTKGEVGSLYLWDQERDLYVLRAQFGWQDNGWVDAATYNKDAGWFGARALQGQPRHIPNLYEYYEREGYNLKTDDPSKPGGLYAQYMFGRNLCAEHPVEVIGLPLQIGQNNDIGIVASYRFLNGERATGFPTTLIKAIQSSDERALASEAAQNISGLVAALLQHLDDKTEREEQERRKRVSDVLSATIEQESDESFEQLLTSTVAQAYEAVRADYYAVVPAGVNGTRRLELKAAFGRGLPFASHSDSEFIAEVLSTYERRLVDDEINSEDILVARKSLTPEQRINPKNAALEGLVERISLPLVRGKELIGIIDLQWKVDSPLPYDAEVHLRKKYLWQLAEDLSKFTRLFIQTKRRIEAERTAQEHLKNQQGLLGKVGVVAQLAHDWRHRIRELMKEASDSKIVGELAERERSVGELLSHLREFGSEVDDLLELTKWSKLRPRAKELLGLFERKDDNSIFSKRFKRKIRATLDIPDGLQVKVTPISMRFAFQNIVDNAIKATQEIPDPCLEISAEIDNDHGRVTVRIFNAGEQISSSIRDAINNNLFEELEDKWGLVIAKCFAQYDGGDLTIETPNDGGTVSVFNLPLPEKEKERNAPQSSRRRK